MLSLSTGCAISASVRERCVKITVIVSRLAGGTMSSISTASPVTSMPSRIRRAFNAPANHNVGLPTEIASNGRRSHQRESSRRSVSDDSPGRCSGQSSCGDPGRAGRRRGSSRASAARGSTATLGAAPGVAPGVTDDRRAVLRQVQRAEQRARRVAQIVPGPGRAAAAAPRPHRRRR